MISDKEEVPVPPPRPKKALKSDTLKLHDSQLGEKKRPVAIVLPNPIVKRPVTTSASWNPQNEIKQSSITSSSNNTRKECSQSVKPRPRPVPRKRKTESIHRETQTEIHNEISSVKNRPAKPSIRAKPSFLKSQSLDSLLFKKLYTQKPPISEKPPSLRNRSLTIPVIDDSHSDYKNQRNSSFDSQFNKSPEPVDLNKNSSEISDDLKTKSVSSETLGDTNVVICDNAIEINTSKSSDAELYGNIVDETSSNTDSQQEDADRLTIKHTQMNTECQQLVSNPSDVNVINNDSSDKKIFTDEKKLHHRDMNHKEEKTTDKVNLDQKSSVNQAQKSMSYENVVLAKTKQQKQTAYENVSLNKKEFEWVTKSFDHEKNKYKSTRCDTLNAMRKSPVKKQISNPGFDFQTVANKQVYGEENPQNDDNFKNNENKTLHTMTAASSNDNIYGATPNNLPFSIHSTSDTNTWTAGSNNDSIYSASPTNLPFSQNSKCTSKVISDTYNQPRNQIESNDIYSDSPCNLPYHPVNNEIITNNIDDNIYSDVPTNIPSSTEPFSHSPMSEKVNKSQLENFDIYSDTPCNLPYNLQVNNESMTNNLDDNIYSDVPTEEVSKTKTKDDAKLPNDNKLTIETKQRSNSQKKSAFRSFVGTSKAITPKSSSVKIFNKKQNSSQYEEISIKSKTVNRARSTSLLNNEQKEKLMLLHDDIGATQNLTEQDELTELQSRFIHPVDVIKDNRHILKEGILQKLSRKESQQRIFILLTDALLYCAGNINQLKLKLELPLSEMTVELADSEDLRTEFSIKCTKRSLLLNASSAEERNEWVMALKTAISELDSQSSYESVVPSDIGDVAPTWVPDKRVSMCQYCKSKFTVYNRRHHCRACGKVICNSCSSYEAPLKYMNNNVARVCEKCFTHLQYVLQYEDEDDEAVGTIRAKFKTLRTKRTHKTRKERSRTMENNLSEASLETDGFLKVKKGGKRERPHWCVLRNNIFYVYKAFSDPEPYYCLPVLGYQLKSIGDWSKGEYMFELRHKSSSVETITLKADNEDAAKRWSDYLRMATVLLN